MVKPLSRKEATLVNQYLKLISDRRFTDAKGKLDRLGQTIAEKEWSKGYYNALQGIFLALKSKNPRNAYVSRIDKDSPKKIDVARREFLEQSRNPLQRDFDKGFFTAWSDYLRVLKKRMSKKRTSDSSSLPKTIQANGKHLS
jgi:hypothetical protein